jgi:hypothetical protein
MLSSKASNISTDDEEELERHSVLVVSEGHHPWTLVSFDSFYSDKFHCSMP